MCAIKDARVDALGLVYRDLISPALLESFGPARKAGFFLWQIWLIWKLVAQIVTSAGAPVQTVNFAHCQCVRVQRNKNSGPVKWFHREPNIKGSVHVHRQAPDQSCRYRYFAVFNVFCGRHAKGEYRGRKAASGVCSSWQNQLRDVGQQDLLRSGYLPRSYPNGFFVRLDSDLSRQYFGPPARRAFCLPGATGASLAHPVHARKNWGQK